MSSSRLAIATLLLLSIAACTPDATGAPGGVRVTIVGIDGATWKVIDPMLARGELPNFARLVGAGVRADLRSRAPLVSPPVWTTIATGVSRRRHGIRGFIGGKNRTLVSSRNRMVPALWSLASRNGRRAAVIGWWATYPAESIDGVVISDRTLKTRQKSVRRTSGDRALRDTVVARLVHPPDAIDVIDALLDAPVPGGDDLEDFDVVATMRLEDATIARSLLLLRDSHGPFDLEQVLLRGVDPVSHHFWQFHQPDAPVYRDADRPSAEERARVGDPVEDHYRYVDALLGELSRDSNENRVLLIVSDHGFEAGYQGFRKGAKMLLGKHVSENAELGIFLAAGGPVRAGAVLSEAAIFDIAPTVLRLLDLPIADDLPGRVLAEAFDPDWLARHPERRVSAYEGPPNDLAHLDRDADTSSPGDEALKEELRSLGYIE